MKVQITDSKSLDINIRDSRSLSLKSTNIKAIEKKKKYEEFDQTFYHTDILALRFEGKTPYVIELGDNITVDKVKYKINKIICRKNNEYILIDQELNKSAKYLLPLVLPIGARATGYLFNACLYNTYLYCNKYPQLAVEKFLFLKYRFFDDPEYKKLESLIVQQKNFVFIDDSEQGFTTFILDIAEDLTNIIELFKLGKYHVFKEPCERKILNFFNPSINGSMYSVLSTDIKQVMCRDVNRVRILEETLGMELPEGIGLESKPSLVSENLIL